MTEEEPWVGECPVIFYVSKIVFVFLFFVLNLWPSCCLVWSRGS